MRYIALLCLVIFIGCGTESTPSYQLTTTVQPAEAGSISPASGEFDEGTEILLSANANEHWVFSEWQGGGLSGTDNPFTLVMNSDTDVTALFTKKEYPLSIQIVGNGIVLQQIIHPKTTEYQHGSTVELTAVPDAGWNFVSWEGELSGSENPVTILIDDPKNVSAVFEAQTFNVITSVDGKGSVTLNPEKEFYDFGESIELIAQAHPGWEFINWEGDLSGDNNPVNITVDTDKNINAVFSELKPELQLWVCGSTCNESDIRTRKIGFPYTTNAAISMSTTSSVVSIQRYFLRSVSGNFTIMDLKASVHSGNINTEFQGLEDGIIIEPGKDVEFSLIAERTGGRQVNLTYSFGIKETGDIFDFRAQLVTN